MCLKCILKRLLLPAFNETFEFLLLLVNVSLEQFTYTYLSSEILTGVVVSVVASGSDVGDSSLVRVAPDTYLQKWIPGSSGGEERKAVKRGSDHVTL